jgi:hypothetical protein
MREIELADQLVVVEGFGRIAAEGDSAMYDHV